MPAAIDRTYGSIRADPGDVLRARIEARALLYKLGEIGIGEIAADLVPDTFSGLSNTFAAACRNADCEADERYRITKPPAFRLAESIRQAADFLIQQDDLQRFHQWLNGHPARERAAILAHVNKRGTS
jgi:hypothetical protein